MIIIIILNFPSANNLEANQAQWDTWYRANLIVQVQCRILQQMIGCNKNVGGISKSEKMSIEMMMERNYAI